MIEFSELVGKTLTSIDGLHVGSDRVTFTTSDEYRYLMWHEQDCCESVSIEDVNGDVNDLLNAPILRAYESNDPEPARERSEWEDSYTWTFYRISTIKGTVVIRWYGTSNGYYSESVSFSLMDENGRAMW